MVASSVGYSSPVARQEKPRNSRSALHFADGPRYFWKMFTIEHDFDATVITLVDEGSPHLQEDITVQAFEDCVVLEQLDPRTEQVQRLTFSQAQLRDLAAAMNLPEGVYRLKPAKG
jgi:hypothetical protein